MAHFQLVITAQELRTVLTPNSYLEIVRAAIHMSYHGSISTCVLSSHCRDIPGALNADDMLARPEALFKIIYRVDLQTSMHNRPWPSARED